VAREKGGLAFYYFSFSCKLGRGALHSLKELGFGISRGKLSKSFSYI